jgi:hypothetical protein
VERAGIAGADKGLGFAVAHHLGSHHHRGIFAVAQIGPRVLIHSDELFGVPNFKIGTTRTALEKGQNAALVADQTDFDVWQALRCEHRTLDHFFGGVVTAHGIYHDSHFGVGMLTSPPPRFLQIS